MASYRYITYTSNIQGAKQDLIEGDPKYMSPELLKNQFDRPADIFRWVRVLACDWNVTLNSNICMDKDILCAVDFL